MVLGHNWCVQAENEAANSATFPHLPEVSWNVEHDGLKEEHKAHPLVVLVVDALLSGSIFVNTRVRDLNAYLLVEGFRQCECRVNPLIGKIAYH